eukprot:CAMPEP_0171570166 /NCGR_PEP_ID=MMETSP0961-20121227/2782_1 /TAXON_ID=87120 /ORGANISM="Aurantiochytrium limacinum, Strain ATCCMYA-1381" /LENGTH=306 /DNA_ID=CAMNT_0012124603 /DNA_START=224 /DNA_END=1144 /DNA_ORIENTATION=-
MVEQEADVLGDVMRALRDRVGSFTASVGVICGSGFSSFYESLRVEAIVDFAEIPHFPHIHLPGQVGEFVFGHLNDVQVVLIRGRFHSYDGHSMETVTIPIKVMSLFGVKKLVVTNAARSVNPKISAGTLMIISDHIGLPLLAGKHPLVGPLAQSFSGKRFTPMSDAYDVALRQLAWEVADEIGLASCVHRSGTYFMVSGPTYETRAESRMILNMGGDVVGMSTVPEVAVARHCGMRVLGISLATNSIRNEHGPVASHDEVLRTARSREQEIGNLLTEVIAKLDMETFSQIESRLEEAGAAYDATLE